MSDSHTHADTGEALSAHVRAEIDHWLAKFPADRKRSAVIAALHAVQHEKGHLPQASMDAVADTSASRRSRSTKSRRSIRCSRPGPCGRHHISVCTNISCMLLRRRGHPRAPREAPRHQGRREHADGRFYLKQEEECLAACNGAPMMMVNHVYFEHLTPAKVDQILDDHK